MDIDLLSIKLYTFDENKEKKASFFFTTNRHCVPQKSDIVYSWYMFAIHFHKTNQNNEIKNAKLKS